MAGKKFAADFERIDEVKSNDKVLIWDSDTGVVKYATPAQINAKFDDLVADIATATAAAQAAEDARDLALGYKNDAVDAKNDAVSAKNDAVGAKNDAEAAAAAAAGTLANAMTKDGDDVQVLIEAITALEARVANLQAFIIKVVSGEAVLPKLAVEDLVCYGENNIVDSGSGAPSQKPFKAGRIYIDIANNKIYKSLDNANVSNWNNQ